MSNKEESKTTLQAQHIHRAVTPMDIIQQAQASGAGIEQMQQLFELQLRWEENEARKAYNEAIAEFKTEEFKIIKDAVVDFSSGKGRTNYKHSTLANIVDTVVPLLAKYGLSHSWNTRQDGGRIEVTCRVAHRKGHSESVPLSAGADHTGNKNSIQQIGSTITYLQRYTLVSILGLAAHEHDDDGAGSRSSNDQSQFMDDTRFSELFPRWEELIISGKQTPAQLIAFVEKKGQKLSGDQIEAINTIIKEDVA